MRKEKDFLGEILIPEDALYGINAVRAEENFKNQSLFPKEWYEAMGLVKYACYISYEKFKQTAQNNLKENETIIQFFDDYIIAALKDAAFEVSEGKHFHFFITPAIQGGAGTSINMNVNEIITNRALQIINRKPGDYSIIDPILNANVFQSTNDVVPTSLKLAVMKKLLQLEDYINNTRNQTEKCESKFRNVLRLSYTQMQGALPSSYGVLFSTYSDALSRDWWRVSKCLERIKLINLGGGATGSGIAIPRFFIMETSKILSQITGLPLTRSENMADTTVNQDSFVEVHASLKAHAVNLEKIAGDIRLLSADISKESLVIPARQTGSSIMPGKVNPVIPEYVISIVHKVYSNDMLISSLAGQSCLELNAYMPIIGNAILETISLLISANQSLSEHLLKNLDVKEETSSDILLKSPGITTAIIPIAGYHKATELAVYMKENNCNIYEANSELKIIDKNILDDILLPQNLLKTGYSIKKPK